MGSQTTVTIARRMGSGGAYVGRLLAERLGLKYVDREVLHLAAQVLGVEASSLEPSRERLSTFWERLFGGLSFGAPDGPYAPPPVRVCSDRTLFECQTDILREIAAREDCVIVGWGGAYVLPRHERMVNFFFHAPLGFRVRRVMEIYEVGDADRARSMVEESDAVRARYFREMTGKDWACADNYHLCVDTSMSSLPDLSDGLVRFIERRLGARHGAGAAQHPSQEQTSTLPLPTTS
jgi:cytidylate kinase